jgi:hypothetical protein
MCVGFPEWTAQFCVWKTTGKDSSEACAIACQNCAVYSVLPLIMTSHSKIAHFNWECIAPFTPCVLVFMEVSADKTQQCRKLEPLLNRILQNRYSKLVCPVPHWIRRWFVLNIGFSAFVTSWIHLNPWAAVLNYLVCGCNVILQCTGFVCLGNTSDWTLAFISCLKSELVWQSLPKEFAGLVLRVLNFLPNSRVI